MKLHSIVICLFLLLFCNLVCKAENTFYVLHNPSQTPHLFHTLSAVEQNKQSIHIVISQAYQVNETGEVDGYINSELVKLTKNHSIKLMAMITNKAFDQEKIHTFLHSPSAQAKALNTILANLKKYQLFGAQFDFERVSAEDKEALTRFYQIAAKAFHQDGFAISFAIIPAFNEKAEPSNFLRRMYKNWSGAYDLSALGKIADFVTVMAYNQHPDGTMPGPNASFSWVDEAIRVTLKSIPAHKISLGVPAYSLYWYAGSSSVKKAISPQRLEIDYLEAKKLIEKNHSKVIWNQKDKVNYAVYERNWLNEYIYLEDLNSFKAKVALANKYNLRGISVFRIGTEDTRIWNYLQVTN